ncbi:dihydrolipoyllysine-residue acetyltransferase component of pyruvate dehydrogenase complex, mitochondrial [Sitodiplosis mosellana]|uniref:dihydrolipoyllysine-residue acetyltransferase component of pyruvate dehydrogenase complex, mitochondrial n=1 Tax=Sitodiplosis mosellana TaxID=263140 RepID=UPI002443CE0A|nr:dihydrolipoyllysine-residue acetyltransferase component of pyruvate dehydrogenase complex, mitochondrial [Sitodiplosis mosellana]XP_055303897.1 dihydrolipoyllysine-residue acetyltransferase component of pyruvate dehydrogenase complex, mitochondrial [Sitodiplosis mosellana]XP_055303898.1 dihydrolipoyllysine-residue acetyltransferase component of pyruvate dehydrogenase complex, mitochondrial [Sitodiplosis mosellana]
MLRTIVARNENLLRGSLKKVTKLNAVRCLSYRCAEKFTSHRAASSISQSRNLQPSVWKVNFCRGYCSNLPPHTRVTLPALSPTMELGTIVSWEKKVGDKLNEGDLLAEIETDKATMGFETPEEGYLAKILIEAGQKDVPIGKLVCIIVENEADVAAFKDFKDTGAPAAAPAAAPAPAAAAPPTPTPPPIVAAPVAPSAPRPMTAVEQRGPRVYASPMAKRLAEAQSLRLEGQGSGAYGSITSKDLGSLSSGAASAPAPASIPAGAAYIDIPVSNTRTVIAKRLLESKVTIPHYYLTVDINVDNLSKVRAEFNKQLEKEGVKLSFNDFVVKATALASKKVPEANSSWHGSFIRQYDSVECSVAVATDKGLITPIVSQADRKGLIEINKAIKELAAKARDGKLQPHEFQGGTITVSNLGMFGVTHFCAVINPPQSCILAVGGTQQRIVPDKDSEKGFKQSDFISVTLSCDHRTVDGAVGARWLQWFQKFLENPHSMLL